MLSLLFSRIFIRMREKKRGERFFKIVRDFEGLIFLLEIRIFSLNEISWFMICRVNVNSRRDKIGIFEEKEKKIRNRDWSAIENLDGEARIHIFASFN